MKVVIDHTDVLVARRVDAAIKTVAKFVDTKKRLACARQFSCPYCGPFNMAVVAVDMKDDGLFSIKCDNCTKGKAVFVQATTVEVRRLVPGVLVRALR